MRDHNEDKQPDSNRIKPAAINLSHAEKSPHIPVTDKKAWSHFFLGTVLTLLLIVAAAVIFILPEWNQSSDMDISAFSGNKETGTKTTITQRAKPEASPWSEAQLAKLRKETQDVLSNLLKQQKILEDMNVALWAEKEYAGALESAEVGDRAYRQREFEEAKTRYQLALDIFNQLSENSEEYYSSAMEKGQLALENAESEQAAEAFQAALLIKPEDGAAKKGLNRSAILDEVFVQIDQGKEQLQNNLLDEAKQSFQQALSIDSDTTLAKEKLKEVNARITDRDFNRAMTKGYAALDNSQWLEARAAFLKARKIKPNTSDVTAALSLAISRLTSENINKLLAKANEHEQKEEWLAAVHAYDKALALDESLNNAQQGREKAQWRSNLDKRLNMAVAKPERLSDLAVYNEARALLHEARSISRPGDKLKRQLAVLGVMLGEALTPTMVIFRSNNRTEVSIHRIGKLGLFERKELELKPGRYVVVGQRDGYRDVRVEFTVIANKTPPHITIQCEEKIASRR